MEKTESKKQNKKDVKIEEHKKQRSWLIKIFIITFFLSAIFNTLSAKLVENLNIFFSILVLVVVILIGIISDAIATAVTAASETPFHSKAADKKKGAKESVKLIKNADRVSNICGDVVGDICGVLSGATGALIATNIAVLLNQQDITLTTLLVTATITALTVLGKGIGKQVGIKKCDEIIEVLGKIIAFLKIEKKSK